MGRITMTHIAREAGVSIATVGRVIHNNGYVSPEARDRVTEAVNRLGYVPDTMARALKSRKSGLIGSMVVYNPNQLYEKINRSVTEAAEARGYRLVTLLGRHERRDEEEIIDSFIGMRVDGLVITSNGYVTPGLLDKIHAHGIPVVAVERNYNHPFVDNIQVRDRKGVSNGIQRMVRAGHRRIALIASGGAAWVEQERMGGYVQAMKEAGLPLAPEYIKTAGEYGVDHGRRAMEELLRCRELPTAVFCTADTLAAGAMQAIFRAGKRVPEDFSLVGYDNVLAAQLAPPIDSVDLALNEMGDLLFSLLERRMREPDCSPRTEYLNTVYQERGTVKAP